MIREMRDAWETIRIVNPAAAVNAAAATLEGLLRRPSPRSLPASLDIVLTKACNLRCVFCISYETLESSQHWMDFSLYERIAAQLFPTALGVYFCSGGEPFLYPRLRDALRLSRAHRTRATITSNGMLITPDVAEWIVEDQSLHELCISFDGACKETVERIRVGAHYETILDNISRLTALKKKRGKKYPRLWFRFAVMRSNAQELPEIIDLAAARGMYKVEAKFLNVTNEMPFEESLYNHRALAAEVFAAASRRGKERGVDFQAPAFFAGAPRRGRRTCLRPWQFCQIDTDGAIRICYYCWRQRLGFIGEHFETVWRGEHYQKIRSTIDTETPYYPFCRYCPVRLGPHSPEAHSRELHQDAYCIPGLESLQTSFNRRREENIASFRELRK